MNKKQLQDFKQYLHITIDNLIYFYSNLDRFDKDEFKQDLAIHIEKYFYKGRKNGNKTSRTKRVYRK